MTHAAYGMLSHASCCTAPAGVDSCNDTVFSVGQQDGRTIRYTDGKRAAVAADQNIRLFMVCTPETMT